MESAEKIVHMPKRIVIKEPTLEEKEASSKLWWDALKDVSVHAYYASLKDYMLPLKMVDIPERIIQELPKLADMKEADSFQEMAELQHIFGDCISPALTELNCRNRFFIKLMSRSPKDFLYEPNQIKPKALTSTHDALEALQGSMRTFEDFIWMWYLKDVKPYFVVQPYVEFDPKFEFRCFVKDGLVKGITQYYYEHIFDYSGIELRQFMCQAKSFVYDIITPAMKTDTFVADVIYLNNAWWLLETNPYGMSDPCLFKTYNKFNYQALININGVVKTFWL